MISRNCQRFQDFWDAYKCNALSSTEMSEVESHLAMCPACKDIFTLIEGSERITAQTTPDPFLLRRIAVAAADMRRAPRHGRTRTSIGPMYIAGAAIAFTAVAVGLFLLLWQFPTRPKTRVISPSPPTPPATAERNDVMAPRFTPDGRRILDIFPGTSVYLSADAILATIVADTELTRLCLIRGTLVAEIGGHSAGYRFIVTTPMSEIEARGTLFSVSVDLDGREETKVVEGVVEVRGLTPRPSTVLVAGQGVVTASGNMAQLDVAVSDKENILCAMNTCADKPTTKNVAAASPSLPRTRTRLKTKQAELAMKEGRLAEASLLTDELLATSPRTTDSMQLLSQLARAYRRAKQFDEAKRVYLRILQRFPKSTTAAESLVALGQIEYRTLRSPEDALRRFETYLEHHGTAFLAETARAERIRVLERLNRTSQVVAAATDYLMHHPSGLNHAEVLRRKADALARLGRCGEAIPTYQEVIRKWPAATESTRARRGLEGCR